MGIYMYLFGTKLLIHVCLYALNQYQNLNVFTLLQNIPSGLGPHSLNIISNDNCNADINTIK